MLKTKTILLSAVALFLITAISSCKKEDATDLTTDVVGHYTSGSGSGAIDIYVTRIDNNTISVNVQEVGSNFTHTSTHMDSKTAFTLNSFNDNSSSNYTEFSGSGSCGANNITVVSRQKYYSGGTMQYDNTYTYSGTK